MTSYVFLHTRDVISRIVVTSSHRLVILSLLFSSVPVPAQVPVPGHHPSSSHLSPGVSVHLVLPAGSLIASQESSRLHIECHRFSSEPKDCNPDFVVGPNLASYPKKRSSQLGVPNPLGFVVSRDPHRPPGSRHYKQTHLVLVKWQANTTK